MADETEAEASTDVKGEGGGWAGAARISRGVIAAFMGGVMVVVLVAWAVSAGGGEPDDTADKSPGRETGDRNTSSSTRMSTTTIAPSTTTTAPGSTVPPTTTARRPTTSTSSLAPLPPPPSTPYDPEPLPPDPRPKALDSSASCSLQDDGSILATASVKWSDGFTDTGTATFTTAGRQTLTTTHRNWVFGFFLTAPPFGAIGDLACQAPDGGSGALYWDG